MEIGNDHQVAVIVRIFVHHDKDIFIPVENQVVSVVLSSGFTQKMQYFSFSPSIYSMRQGAIGLSFCLSLQLLQDRLCNLPMSATCPSDFS